MLKQGYKTWVEISRQALLQNTRALKKLVGAKTNLMAVVKANAYGHDAKLVVPILKQGGADWFGVDSIDEAMAIEPLAGDMPILMLGYTVKNRLEETVKHGFRLTVYNAETIRALGSISKRLAMPARVHIKCETGTARQGVMPQELVPFVKKIGKYPNIIIEGLSSHFANIEDTKNTSFAETQIVKFQRMVGSLKNIGVRIPMLHLCSTAALLSFKEAHFNMVRAGIGLYGLWPSEEIKKLESEKRKSFKLEPALSWKTCVAQIKKFHRGTAIGYGLTEKLSRESMVAVIPIGYYDGFPRAMSSVGEVLIHGRHAKVLGRVCMDMFMVDVTNIRGISVEDEVTIIGRDGRYTISAEEFAEKIKTINYEVVTRINPLIPRVLV